MEAALPRQPFAEHVRELRTRLLWVAVTLALAAGLAYQFHTELQRFLLTPLHQPVFYTSPTGGLSFVLKICIYFGVLVSVPVAIYHIVRFMEPLLPSHQRRQVVVMTSFSGLLLLSGVLFAYFAALPIALHFFGTFSSSQIRSLISTNEYLSFALVYLVGFGILFQLPLVMIIINRITPMSARGMIRALRYVIVASLILAAVFTPTLDLVNQTLLAVPMVLLYLFSVLLVWMANRRQREEPVPEALQEFRQEMSAVKHSAEATLQNVLDLRKKD